jgi:RimJ/RimL family protein N-acetyltransferase
MFDLEQGWQTDRLVLEPLTVAHAAELAPLLNDRALHDFIGGSPLGPAALADRYARLQTRRSPDGARGWGNWVLRRCDTGMAVGTVQVTLPVGGPDAGPAEVAWVVARAAQGNGFATEAAVSLVRRLGEAGWTVVAHVHPDHAASQRVARAVGLSPTGQVVAGEVRWTSSPGAAPRSS